MIENNPQDQVKQQMNEFKNLFRSQLLCCCCLNPLALHDDFYMFTGLEPDTPIEWEPRVVFWDQPVAGAIVQPKRAVFTLAPQDEQAIAVKVGFATMCKPCADLNKLGTVTLPKLLFFVIPIAIDGVQRSVVCYYRADTCATTDQVGSAVFSDKN